ncbi:MAG: dipeptidase [Desulfarculaceae bacterium]|jgi:membrane dipeptidase
MQIELDEKQEVRAMDLHRKSLVLDDHSDVHLDVIRSRGRGEDRVFERRFLKRWKEAGLNAVVLGTVAKFGPEVYPYRVSPVHNFLLMADAIHQEILESPDHFFPILEPDDMARAQEEKRIGLMLGLEGAEPLEQDLGFLRCYFRLGMRVMNLTWHQRNQVADGVAEPSNSGLSNFGREVVREMNRLGILIDVSHLSPAGVNDVLQLSTQPVVASHSNAKAVCPHQRNLDDEHIKGIAEKGGVIGITFLGRFVADENATLSDVLDHVDHMAELVGPAHLSVGPDFTDHCADMIISARRVAGPGQPVDDTSIPYAEGLDDVTKLPNFTRGLVSRGYSDNDIRGILGENYLRVFREVYEGATGQA